MILEEYKVITVNYKNKKYWLSKGYIFDKSKLPIELEIKTSDLSNGSPISVLCKCDICEKEYEQRFSRNTDICSTCRISNRMKGNDLGSKNQGLVINVLQFKKDLEKVDSLTELAKKYNVSLQSVRGFIKRNNISIPTYFGNKRKDINTKELKNDCTQNILSLSEIKRKYNITQSTLKRLAEEYNFLIPKTQFEVWEEEYQKLYSKAKFLEQQNTEKSLKDIAIENGYSIEHLKKVFREHDDLNLILHSYNKSKGQQEVQQYIESLGFSCTPIKKTHNGKKYEIDCFVEEKKFGIEYCGEWWHCDINKEKKYHQEKYIWAKEQSIAIYTIFESEWKHPNKRKIIESIIKNKLGFSTVIMGRKTVCNKISSAEATQFFNENHLQGHVNAKYYYGLFDKNTYELISAISFSKNRFSKNENELELIRYCSKVNFSIIGGFSKLFKFSSKDIKQIDQSINQIISFANLRFGNGNVYKKAGFDLIDITTPNYWYFNKKTGKIESRLKYQKHKLTKLFPDSKNTSEKTEKQILLENGFLRLYDCGNAKYIYEL